MRRVLDQRFEILVELHSGSGGRLFYAWDRLHQRAAAVREMRTSDSASPGQDWLRVARQAALLAHPSVVPTYALSRDAHGAHYIVTSFVDGLDIRSVLDRLAALSKRLPEMLVWYLVDHVLDALVVAHGSSTSTSKRPALIHGMLDAERVLVDATGRVLVADFVTPQVRRSLGRTMHAASQRWGEAAEASDRDPTRRLPDPTDDLTGISWLIYEAMTGDQSPASGREFRRIGSTGLSEEAERAFGVARFSPEMQGFLARAFAPSRARRFASATVMRDELRRSAGPIDTERCRAEWSLVVQGLLSPSEAEQRRRLVMLRGGSGGAVEDIATTDLLISEIPVDPETPTEAVAPDDMPTRRFSVTVPMAHRTEPSPAYPRERPSEALPSQPRGGRPRRLRRRVAIGGLIAILALAAWYLLDRSINRMAGAPSSVFNDSLYLQTVPPGASVRINGDSVGITPWPYGRLEPGPLRLEFVYAGFAPIETVLVIRETDALSQMPDFVFTTSMTFSTLPAGGRPIVDGRPLRDREAVGYILAADDTITVEFEFRGQGSLGGRPSARLNPVVGLLPPTDTVMWRWEPSREGAIAVLTGLFVRTVRLVSEPPGALIFLDGDLQPVGTTNSFIEFPYGEHTVHLQRPPFLDYQFSLDVGEQTPSVYAAVLRRTVRINAVNARRRSEEVTAAIAWIRVGDQYVRSPDDGLSTPYSLTLDGRPHDIYLTADGFADTTVLLDAESMQLTVAMREAERSTLRQTADESESESWVRFIVRDGRTPVAGAEVIGIEKASGEIVRYGLTDPDGELTTQVPIGDYDWQASKYGFEGKINGERISPSNRTKKITLSLRPL